jgi:dTDP-4-amino-4,6-dideoxygalactose transaminase
MKVSFFDLKRIYRMTEHEIDREIRHVLESGHYIIGNACKNFELQMKESIVEAKEGYAIGCNSGTDALILPMLALDIGPGDEVLTVSHTAIPTITAIRSTGAIPIFCDLDTDTWLLNIEDAIQQLTPRTKAVVAVHIYGNMVNIPKLRKALDSAGRSDVKIIEDVAQAQGSWLESDGKTYVAGSMGDFSSFSFYPTKNVGALGDAGCVFTKNPEWAEKITMLRNYGQKDRYNALIDRGLNSRLDEMQAAILSVRLKYLNKWGDKKDQMRSHYLEQLSELPLRFQKTDANVRPNWHLCVLALDQQIDRNLVIKQLDEKGVQCLIHYPIPTHNQKAFEKYRKRSLPVTEALAQSIISLPLNPGLMPEEVRYVSETLKTVIGTNKI